MKVRVNAFAISLDGFGAGPGQEKDHPLGIGGAGLHQWFYPTKVFQTMFGNGQGTTGVDNAFAERGMAGIGAWIMGRNMFTPYRGPWKDDSWKGWWGEEPPYHTPVYILTHHARKPLEMKGGTTFHFVTDGIESALDQAKRAAAGKDVRIGGGASTIRQYLKAGLIDEMHLVTSPMLLGTGESLLEGIDLLKLGFKCTEHAAGDKSLHVILSRS